MRVNCSLTLVWTSWCSRSQKRVPQSSAGRCRNWREKSALASISRMLLSSLAIHIPEQSKNDLRTPPPAWGEAASLIGFLRIQLGHGDQVAQSDCCERCRLNAQEHTSELQ